jgi:Domain of unknown function (DUF4340)
MNIKPQHFAVLAAVTALAVVTSALTYGSVNRWSTGKVEGKQLLANFTRDAGNAHEIEIAQGEKKLVLERAGEQWRLKDRDGYPANAERVRALLLALQRSELIEPRTAAKDKLKLLELEDPTGKDAKSRSLRVLDAKARPLAEIVLGKARHDAFGSGKGGAYVRRPAETQAWLATGEFRAPVEVREWVQTTIFEFDSAKIVRVTVEHAGEDPLVVEKGDEKQKFKLARIPDGLKLKEGANVDQIATGFASIDLEDMRKLDKAPPLDKPVVVKLEGEGGASAIFRIRRDGDAAWLSFEAAGEGDAKPAADEINARAKGWEFKIPAWKADQIGKRHADLFETT